MPREDLNRADFAGLVIRHDMDDATPSARHPMLRKRQPLPSKSTDPMALTVGGDQGVGPNNHGQACGDQWRRG